MGALYIMKLLLDIPANTFAGNDENKLLSSSLQHENDLGTYTYKSYIRMRSEKMPEGSVEIRLYDKYLSHEGASAGLQHFQHR